MDLSGIVGGLLGGSIGSALITFALDRWKSRLGTVQTWKEQAISELYGPLVMHFDRTKRAFDRYRGSDLFIEAEVMAKSNTLIRDLLLTKGHFITSDLLDQAGKLIEHYDVWLAEFARVVTWEQNDRKPIGTQIEDQQHTGKIDLGTTWEQNRPITGQNQDQGRPESTASQQHHDRRPCLQNLHPRFKSGRRLHSYHSRSGLRSLRGR